MIKAVLFDVDGVLLNSFDANLNFFQELMPKLGYSPPTRKTYSRMFHLTMFDVIKKLTQPVSEKETQKAFLKSKKFLDLYRYDLIGTPDRMDQIILKLNKEFKLGIVTSRVKGKLLKYSQFRNINHCFKTAVFFEDTKKHKPDPEPLLFAIKKLAVKPAETVYIGDAKSDEEAAKKAGVNFVYYSVYDRNCKFDKLPELILNI